MFSFTHSNSNNLSKQKANIHNCNLSLEHMHSFVHSHFILNGGLKLGKLHFKGVFTRNTCTTARGYYAAIRNGVRPNSPSSGNVCAIQMWNKFWCVYLYNEIVHLSNESLYVGSLILFPYCFSDAMYILLDDS